MAALYQQSHPVLGHQTVPAPRFITFGAPGEIARGLRPLVPRSRSGPPARSRARRPTRLADSPGCRTPDLPVRRGFWSDSGYCKSITCSPCQLRFQFCPRHNHGTVGLTQAQSWRTTPAESLSVCERPCSPRLREEHLKLRAPIAATTDAAFHRAGSMRLSL